MSVSRPCHIGSSLSLFFFNISMIDCLHTLVNDVRDATPTQIVYGFYILNCITEAFRNSIVRVIITESSTPEVSH